MNRLSTTMEAQAYEPVTYSEGSYCMTPADFDDGCFIRTVNGKPYGTGMNSAGITITAPLGVPLCNGCDTEIADHQCGRCELVFVDDETILDLIVEELPNGSARVEA